MSTPATIAILNLDGTTEAISTNWDGYTSHHAPILMTHYATEALVRALIGLGDLSALDNEIGVKTDWDKPAPGQCIAYGRDRGERGTTRRRHKTLKDLMRNEHNTYIYVFDVETLTWHICDGPNMVALHPKWRKVL